MGESAGARHRVAGRILLGIGLLLVQIGASSAAASDDPPRLAVEEVLRQSARITWTQANGATEHRLQRRSKGSDGTWSAWIDVDAGVQQQAFVIDAGPDGRGLTPAEYGWQMQSRFPGAPGDGWSEWSPPVELAMPPQCAGGENPPGNEAPGALPTVKIDDLDGNGRYTGADVWLALQRCSKLGGCVLEALPVTYDDVAISLYGQNDNRPCYQWNPVVCEPMPPFPKGLVIQGHGSATVFRSPIWKTPYKPAAIFDFWHAPGIQLRFRNFVFDGRKREQPDPTPGVNNSDNDWRHFALAVTNYFGPHHEQRYPDGCVHNVTVRDFLQSGIKLDHVRNWRIEYNRVQDVGCWKGLTDCPLLTIPDNMPPPGWGCYGFKSVGYGIYLADRSDDTQIAHNEITRVAKYALAVKSGEGGVDAIPRVALHDNRIANVGVLGIFLAGMTDGVVERNTIDGTHAYGCRDGTTWNSWGIQTSGTLIRTQVRNNTLRNLAGVGIGSNARADDLVFADNRIDNVCVERNAKVGSVQAAIQLGDGTSGTFLLSNNEVRQNHCSMALALGWKSSAEVLVDGGYYSTADNCDADFGAVSVFSDESKLSPLMVLKGGVVIDHLGTQRRPGLVAKGNGRLVVEDDSVEVKRYRDRLVESKACVDHCSVQKPGRVVDCAARPSDPECQ